MVKALLNYFLILRPKNMLNLCLIFKESQPVYAYKRYAGKKECIRTHMTV